jgi:hypothetical protein
VIRDSGHYDFVAVQRYAEVSFIVSFFTKPNALYQLTDKLIGLTNWEMGRFAEV